MKKNCFVDPSAGAYFPRKLSYYYILYATTSNKWKSNVPFWLVGTRSPTNQKTTWFKSIVQLSSRSRVKTRWTLHITLNLFHTSWRIFQQHLLTHDLIYVTNRRHNYTGCFAENWTHLLRQDVRTCLVTLFSSRIRWSAKFNSHLHYRLKILDHLILLLFFHGIIRFV